MPITFPKVSFAQQIHLDAASTMSKGILTQSKIQNDLKIAANTVKTSNLKVSKADAEAIAKFYNAVVLDGRFIKELSTNPQDVANKLKIKLSPSAIKNFQSAIAIAASGHGGTVSTDVELVAVAVIVVIICLDVAENVANTHVIMDESGILKY